MSTSSQVLATAFGQVAHGTCQQLKAVQDELAAAVNR
jgi:hypothetical protein